MLSSVTRRAPVKLIKMVKMDARIQTDPETPDYILTISECIIRYARGDISLKEYQSHLESWYEQHGETWQENDFATVLSACRLFETTTCFRHISPE